MKLVEIKDIRVGQIYRKTCDRDCYLLISEINKNKTITYAVNSRFGFYLDECNKKNLENILENSFELVGFLGITHEIKDKKLVKIPREELETDDVIEFAVLREESDFEVCKVVYRFSIIQDEEETFICVGNNGNSYNVSRNDFNGKVGILGVNYEFVNNQLVK